MPWLFQPLLTLLARSADSQLARQVEFLHAENQMLRRRVTKRVRLSGQEKARLVKLGQAIGGRAVKVLLTVVAYATYRHVGQVDASLAGTPCPGSGRKPGRPKTSDEVREGEGGRQRGFFVSYGYTKDAEDECRAFFKRTKRIIKLLTVQEILDEEHLQKM
jgi:hypothetical protein